MLPKDRLESVEKRILVCECAIISQVGKAMWPPQGLAMSSGTPCPSYTVPAPSTTPTASSAGAAETDQGHLQASTSSMLPIESPTQHRLQLELQERGLVYRFMRVPADYYDQELTYRQQCVQSSSVDHLCKTIIMENTRFVSTACQGESPSDDPLHPSHWADPCNSRYYFVIVQYTARLHSEKLNKLVHKLAAAATVMRVFDPSHNTAHAASGKISKQQFNLRLAPEVIGNALSGFEHNAVTPIGAAVRLPIIISHKVVELGDAGLFFLGAGETDLKVGLCVSEFMAHYQPASGDITY